MPYGRAGTWFTAARSRETIVVGVVGAGGLGVLLAERIAGFDYGGVISVLAAPKPA